MSAVIDSNVWEERRRDVELMQLDARRMVEYHDWLSSFEGGSETIVDRVTADECVDLVREFEALVSEHLRQKAMLPELVIRSRKMLTPADVGGIIIDMIQEKWDREAQIKADEVD